jgi:hypothetical protein
MCPEGGGADEPYKKTDNVEPQSYVCRTHRARMVFKLVEAAQKTWRRLDSHSHLPKLIVGVRFTDGLEAVAKKGQRSAHNGRRLTDQVVTRKSAGEQVGVLVMRIGISMIVLLVVASVEKRTRLCRHLHHRRCRMRKSLCSSRMTCSRNVTTARRWW